MIHQLTFPRTQSPTTARITSRLKLILIPKGSAVSILHLNLVPPGDMELQLQRPQRHRFI